MTDITLITIILSTYNNNHITTHGTFNPMSQRLNLPYISYKPTYVWKLITHIQKCMRAYVFR